MVHARGRAGPTAGPWPRLAESWPAMMWPGGDAAAVRGRVRDPGIGGRTGGCGIAKGAFPAGSRPAVSPRLRRTEQAARGLAVQVGPVEAASEIKALPVEPGARRSASAAGRVDWV